MRMRVAEELATMVNKYEFPEYLREGRLVALSRGCDNQEVKLDNVRPIIVLSHIRKIIE